jgi:3-oxoacyl-[acyl-carrier protein] reductase
MGGQEKVVALVTGGSDGIGRAAAVRLCAEGAKVAIVARGLERLQQALEQIDPGGTGRAIAISADCTDMDDLVRVHEEATERLGPITALVNNVGTSLRGPFLEVTDDQWKMDLELKLFSAIRLSRMVIPGMIERGDGGRIVNVLSIGGKHPGAASGPTAMTRAAGLALTQALSKEFAPHGILVNAVCIGLIRAGQHDARWRARGGEESLDQFYADMARARNVPLGRVGEASEAGALINFLVSDDASFISGTAINVDGAASWSL